MSTYSQRPAAAHETAASLIMNNPFVQSFSSDFPFAVDSFAQGMPVAITPSSSDWRGSRSHGRGQPRLPPPYVSEFGEAEPSASMSSFGASGSAAAAAFHSTSSSSSIGMGGAPSTFTLDEYGRPVGMGAQTWETFGKDSSTSGIEVASSETDAKGRGDVFDNYYPPTVSLPTGDRFSQLLEAKLGLDSTLQTPGVGALDPNSPHALATMNGFAKAKPASSNPDPNPSTANGIGGRSFSSSSGTPWSQSTSSQLNTPSLSHAPAYGLQSKDSFSIERALHDPAQLQISPDLVAALPNMARYPWNAPCPPTDQRLSASHFNQGEFAASSQQPDMHLHGQHSFYPSQDIGQSVPGGPAGPSGYLAQGQLPIGPTDILPMYGNQTASYAQWHAPGPQQIAQPDATLNETFTSSNTYLPQASAEAWSSANGLSASPFAFPQAIPLSSDMAISIPPRPASLVSTSRSPLNTSPRTSPKTAQAKPVVDVSQAPVAGPSVTRKRKGSSAQDKDSSDSDIPPLMSVHPPAFDGSGAEGGEEKRPIVIACHNCRAKKLKCDGVKPKCHHCSRRGQPTCEYDSILRRRGKGKNPKKRARRDTRGADQDDQHHEEDDIPITDCGDDHDQWSACPPSHDVGHNDPALLHFRHYRPEEYGS